MKSLKEKVVWITGASSGIGEELAYEMAREGARLVLSARNQEKLNKVKDNCLTWTDKCWVQAIDLSSTNGLEQVVDKVYHQAGNIDILVNSAGRSQRSLAIETPLENDRQIMELNFFSVVSLSKLVLERMLKNKNGHIVVVSSISGKFGFPWRTAYAASKHAMQGYFESLRAELKPYNIPVTIISPGRIRTNISLNALTETGEAYNKMDDGQAKGLAADQCALKIVQAIKKERKDVLVGKSELLMVHIRRFLPALYHLLVTKISN